MPDARRRATKGAWSVIAPLLVTLTAEAQPASELLQDLSEDHAARLEEYNSVFLKKQTYFASRYRIVTVDTDLLLEERDITVTPFDDVEPIGINWHKTRRSWGMFKWIGLSDDPNFADLGESAAIQVWMNAWEVDESGKALNSFQDSPAFYSVSAVFEIGTRSRYILQPLQYTPRYSVIYEIAPGTIIPFTIDASPGEQPLPSAEVRAISERYRAAMDSLPKEEDKEIRGDL